MTTKQRSIQLVFIIIFILRLSIVSDLATFQSLEATSNKVLPGNMDLSLGNAFQLLQLKIPAIKTFASGEGFTQCSLPYPLISCRLSPLAEFLNRRHPGQVKN